MRSRKPRTIEASADENEDMVHNDADDDMEIARDFFTPDEVMGCHAFIDQTGPEQTGHDCINIPAAKGLSHEAK